jgi:hypothetical protein
MSLSANPKCIPDLGYKGFTGADKACLIKESNSS